MRNQCKVVAHTKNGEKDMEDKEYDKCKLECERFMCSDFGIMLRKEMNGILLKFFLEGYKFALGKKHDEKI